MENIPILKKSLLFSGLDEEYLAEVAAISKADPAILAKIKTILFE